MSQQTRRLPDWYWPIGKYTLGVCLAFVVIYALGYEAAYRRGVRISLGREDDSTLYRIDDEWAWWLDRSDNLSIVKYRLGTVPFRPICGIYEVNGTVVNVVRYRSGDWIYSDYASPQFPFAANVRTKQVIYGSAFFGEAGDKPGQADTRPSPEGTFRAPPDMATLQSADVSKRNGWTFDKSDRLSRSFLRENYEALATINESGVVLLAGCILVLLLYVTLGMILVSISSLRRLSTLISGDAPTGVVSRSK